MYTIHLWNKKYGNPAKFIVEDNQRRFTEFSPARPKDIAWVKTDLTKDPSYKEWDDFQKEKVESLDGIVM